MMITFVWANIFIFLTWNDVSYFKNISNTVTFFQQFDN